MTAAYDLRPVLGDITATALVCTGRYDFITPLEECGQPLAAGLPNATLAVFERSGHMPFLEEPEDFTDRVASFIDSSGNQ